MSLLSSIQQLTDFDTALIANTIGYLDATPVNEWYMGGDIASLTPTVGPTVGVAMTCEIDSSTPGNRAEPEGYYALLKAIEQCAEPVVLVIKAVGSRPEHECVIGDGMAKMLHSVGCIGVVTNGGVRDIEGILTLPFGVYARGRTIHHCAIRCTRYNQPVEVGGITVSPGEIIHANIGGVIKVPAGALARLPALAGEMRSFEHAAHCIFRQTDLTIDEKRRAVDALVAGLKRS
ncbi:MAG: bifunctional hexulose-6-phosphate synthase/ribonuclease regulator [Verrucomicrobia bacterium]|nr:bifunctional hexulose-6-phosphate synthase/ribonuclease regulator [Verrucomicrobiota bacterium]